MKKVLIYGTGKAADYYFEHHDFVGSNELVVGFVETRKTKDYFKEKHVYSVSEIDILEWDEIHVASSYLEVLWELEKENVPTSKIVLCNQMLKDLYVETEHTETVEIAYNREDAEDYEKTVRMNERFVTTSRMKRNIDKIGQERISFDLRMTYDYFRYVTLMLIAELIKENGIKGELAELGVYKGDFAKVMNALFPEKRLLLFDTFEGFSEKDVEYDLADSYSSREWFDEVGNFKDGSLEITMKKMKYPENCIIRQGFFPETIPNEEYKYCLVSLDCDLYQPIFEGLKYFYPRMERGGYIMIHDYNREDNLKGVKQAVADFEKEYGFISKVPLADIAGTIVLCKND